jgi:hypothetical protein
VFTNAGAVQAAAALRRCTLQRARSAQETLHRQACTADAGLVQEHQEMLKRYQVHLSATAMEAFAGMDEQVWHTFSSSFLSALSSLSHYTCMIISDERIKRPKLHSLFHFPC